MKIQNFIGISTLKIISLSINKIINLTKLKKLLAMYFIHKLKKNKISFQTSVFQILYILSKKVDKSKEKIT